MIAEIQTNLFKIVTRYALRWLVLVMHCGWFVFGAQLINKLQSSIKKDKHFPELKLCFLHFFAAKHWFHHCLSQRRLLWCT